MHIFYFFGDSITLGVNVLPKNSFYQLILDNLQEKFSVPPTKFYNLGACKNSSGEILARFDNEFSARNLPGSTPVFFPIALPPKAKTIIQASFKKQRQKDKSLP